MLVHIDLLDQNNVPSPNIRLSLSLLIIVILSYLNVILFVRHNRKGVITRPHACANYYVLTLVHYVRRLLYIIITM